MRLAALAKLGEHYEKTERWADAQRSYADIAAHSNDPAWRDAAAARAQAAGARAAEGGVKITSGTSSAAPAEAAPQPKKGKSR
jgi:hypothetical protein